VSGVRVRCRQRTDTPLVALGLLLWGAFAVLLRRLVKQC
jgi:hypothetical protein